MDEARARRVFPGYEKAAAALVEARGFVREADLKGRAVLHRTWRRSCGWRADFFRLATRQGDLLHVEPELGVEVLVPGEKPALVDARPVYYLANGRHAQYALGMVDELRSDEGLVRRLMRDLEQGLSWVEALSTKQQVEAALASRDRNGVVVGSPPHQAALRVVAQLDS